MAKQKTRKIKTPSRSFYIDGRVYEEGRELTEKELKLFDSKKYSTKEFSIADTSED